MLRTFARIEAGAEVDQLVVRGDAGLPEGDWRPVVVEGLDFDRTELREARRDTQIEADRVVRSIVTEPLPPPTREEYGAAVEAHINAVAVARGYSTAVSMISYEGSSVPQFAAEAAALRAWRDNVWVAVAAIEADVAAGERSTPSIADLVAALPKSPF
jgi:hypothetical protein